MKSIGKLKLNKLINNELKKNEMIRLSGGYNCACVCACIGLDMVGDNTNNGVYSNYGKSTVGDLFPPFCS
jgi:natural product precursor